MSYKPLHKCAYCELELAYSPLPEMEIHGVKVYFCHTCKAEYLYWKDGSLASYSLYAKVGDKTYKWNLNGIGRAQQLWQIVEPGIPGVQIDKQKKLLYVFNQSVDVNPNNIVFKIETVLLLL